MNSQELSEIVASCQRGDRKSQRQLYDIFLPYVRALARRYLTDTSFLNDAVQEVFIRVFLRMKDHYTPSKGAFKPWLAKVAINRIFDFNKKHHFPALSIEEESLNIAEIAEDTFFKLEKEDLFQFIDQMPIAYREVFNLYVIDELPHAEIAELLGCKPEASRQRLTRARQWLKGQLKRDSSKIGFRTKLG